MHMNTNILYQPVQVPVYAHEYKHSISTSTSTGMHMNTNIVYQPVQIPVYALGRILFSKAKKW